MAALCRSYSSHADALEAVQAVLDAGIPGEDVRVLTGEPERDSRDESVGEFEGEAQPGDPVGEFAGTSRERGAEGTFAGGPDQRGGSFGDTDRDEVTSYPGGVEHSHIASHHEIRRLLSEAGLDRDAADRDIGAVHEGRVLVLVDTSDRDPGPAEAALGR